MSDRLDRAHALRVAIHGFVSANPRCTMAQIFAAVTERNPHTIRRAIQRMRDDGDIAITSKRANVGRYTAITASVRSASAARAKLADGGRKTQPIAVAAWSEQRKQRSDDQVPTKFHRAERLRAAILALLHAAPGSTSRDVMHGLSDGGIEINLARVSQTLERMERLGEIVGSLDGSSPVNGRRCCAWRALVERTVSAADMLDHIGHNTRKEKSPSRCMAERLASRRAEQAAAQQQAAVEPWKTVYHCGDNPRIHQFRAGGQGCIGRGTGSVQASAGAVIMGVSL